MSGPRLFTPAMVLISGTMFLGALVPNLFVLASKFLSSQGYDEQQIGIAMGGFNVAALAGFPLSGWLAERIGHRQVLVLGCLIAGVGSAQFEWCATLPAYAGARAVQGIGFAAVLVASGAYVAEIAPPSRLAQALGIAGVLTLCSQAVGPLAGEILYESVGWVWVFRGGLIGGCAGACVAAFLPPVSVDAEERETRGQGGLGVLIATGLAGFGFGSVWTFLADYADQAGVGRVTYFFAPYVVAAIGTRVFLGHLPDRIGRRRVAAPALLGHALALALMAILSRPWQAVLFGGMFGFSHGLYYPTLQAMVLERCAVSRSRAIARSTFSFGVGIVVGAFALGAMARFVGYPPIYLVSASAGVIAAVVISRVGPRAA